MILAAASPRSGYFLGIGFAVAAASFYGCVPNFARAAFSNGVPAIETVFLRTSVIAIVLGIVASVHRESFRIPYAAWKSFIAQALATFVVSTCYLASVQFIPVGLAVIIFFAFPVIVVLASPIVEGHAPSLERIGIAVLAFIGLGIAVGPGFETLDIRGVLLAAAAAVGCALQFFSGRTVSTFITCCLWQPRPPLHIALGFGRGALCGRRPDGGHIGLSFVYGPVVCCSGLSCVCRWIFLSYVITESRTGFSRCTLFQLGTDFDHHHFRPFAW